MSTDTLQLALAAISAGDWDFDSSEYSIGTGCAEYPQWTVGVLGTFGSIRREQGWYVQEGEWHSYDELVAVARAMDVASKALNDALARPKAGVRLVVYIADDVSPVKAGSALYEALHGIRRYPGFDFFEVARGKVRAKIAKQAVGYQVEIESVIPPKPKRGVS